ncbi:hypothetical protein CEY16_05340 [Halalkalibacillus sediminis]|uniref:Cytosolic protein n=1 Tax=Halalkalibacillus sediminis TaxID=2018042 RepID=A0A2I0QXV6_9BACI|nr:hypothetical protein [Halalkalibacillus sediminis]PKR79172.1 hypothetical protein CEY16_05340 [Halalkalibacillus sediminis]
MRLDQRAKDLLSEASLYGLLTKRYEYVEPQKHMSYYQRHFNAVMRLEQYLMQQGYNPGHEMSSHHQM